MDMFENATRLHRTVFGHRPEVVARAPGRVNLIGEHTDYNQGLALPLAIDRALYVTGVRGSGDQIVVHSRSMGETKRVGLRHRHATPPSGWEGSVAGVVAGLERRGAELSGCELCVSGDLPAGGGVSSSAALSIGLLLALAEMHELDIEPLDAVLLAQSAEQEFVGTPCGIMDPYVCMFGRKDHALLIDCRQRTHELVPVLPEACRLVLVDSGVRHELSGGTYEQRVRECRAAVAAVASRHPGIESLRDVTLTQLEALQPRMDDVLYRRARHVVTENQRVVRFTTALRAGRIGSLGDVLDEGHRSLCEDYEVSCREVEELVTRLRRVRGVLGARMTGGGFGGNLLIVVKGKAVPAAVAAMNLEDGARGADSPRVLSVRAADGAECRPA
jgi:galactokinase